MINSSILVQSSTRIENRGLVLASDGHVMVLNDQSDVVSRCTCSKSSVHGSTFLTPQTTQITLICLARGPQVRPKEWSDSVVNLRYLFCEQDIAPRHEKETK